MTACALLIAVEHAGVQPLLGHVAPFENVADVIVVGVKGAVDQERDLEIADGDLGIDRQARGVGEQLALMRGVLVKRVDASADDLVGVETRPDRAERRFVLLEQLAGRLVDISYHEVPIDHHDGGRDLVDDTGLQLGNIMAAGTRPGRASWEG